jgi:hypothetical protein
MSEQQKPQIRSEEPELTDEALEQVAGGCEIESQDHDVWTRQVIKPTF